VIVLIARHLDETAGLKFDPLAVRLTPAAVLQGRTVGNLLQGPPFAQLASQLRGVTPAPHLITARGDSRPR
jgi:hypothetical protein